MLKTFLPLRLAFCAVCVLCLFGVQAYGQERDNDKVQTTVHPNGIVQDWSHHHSVYPRVGEIHSLIAVQNDPRALLSWQAAEREDWHRWRESWHHHHEHGALQRDWSISLGLGTTAPAMYPAKFGFDPAAAASCANDFIVFPVNVSGGPIQPNLAAFYQLYSGAGPGLCSSRTPLATTDTLTDAATYWSYNIHTGGGLVPTSPALSLDGTKVAFVESASGTTAHFHVLAWHQGDGVDSTNAQNVLLPLTISTIVNPGLIVTHAPTAGSGTVTDLALGSTSDTLSSPFVDYINDVAYVGNDSGVLFRIKNVFCPPAVGCIGGGTPQPSLDTSWNSTGSVSVCTGVLTGAVVDSNTGNVFVGCSDGNLYGFDSTGTALATPSVAVGTGTDGGVVDPPLIDSVNKFVYAVSGNDGTNEVVVQASTADLSGRVAATMGAGGLFNMHAPAFNDAYFSGSGTALLYDWGLDAGGTQVAVYGVTFTGHAMNPGAAADVFAIAGSSANELSPVTEFLNGATDQLFVCGISNISPNFVEYNINSFPAIFPPGAGGATATEAGGTSGIVVDNVDPSAQASSIYFGVLGSNTAVKLTQAGLL